MVFLLASQSALIMPLWMRVAEREVLVGKSQKVQRQGREEKNSPEVKGASGADGCRRRGCADCELFCFIFYFYFWTSLTHSGRRSKPAFEAYQNEPCIPNRRGVFFGVETGPGRTTSLAPRQ